MHRASLYSIVTAKRVRSATLIPPESPRAVEKIVESFASDLAEFVEECFEERLSSEEAIVDYEKLLQEVRETLKQIAQTKRS